MTGGSRGIGAAVAIALAEQGAEVAITYLHSADEAAQAWRRTSWLRQQQPG